eukprot:PhF_6_TR40779/c0_g1_i1/m.61544
MINNIDFDAFENPSLGQAHRDAVSEVQQMCSQSPPDVIARLGWDQFHDPHNHCFLGLYLFENVIRRGFLEVPILELVSTVDGWANQENTLFIKLKIAHLLNLVVLRQQPPSCVGERLRLILGLVENPSFGLPFVVTFLEEFLGSIAQTPTDATLTPKMYSALRKVVDQERVVLYSFLVTQTRRAFQQGDAKSLNVLLSCLSTMSVLGSHAFMENREVIDIFITLMNTTMDETIVFALATV